jgi:hypothetical protein
VPFVLPGTEDKKAAEEFAKEARNIIQR